MSVQANRTEAEVALATTTAVSAKMHSGIAGAAKVSASADAHRAATAA
jgi:hypothetical protein